MKKIMLLTTLLFVAFFTFLNVVPAGAENIRPEFCIDNPDPAICNINTTQTATENILVGPTGLITRAAQVLVWISGTLAMILIVIAGLMFIFSHGNPESVSRARSTIIYALIGMTVAIVGQAIVIFVLGRL